MLVALAVLAFVSIFFDVAFAFATLAQLKVDCQGSLGNVVVYSEVVAVLS